LDAPFVSILWIIVTILWIGFLSQKNHFPFDNPKQQSTLFGVEEHDKYSQFDRNQNKIRMNNKQLLLIK